VSAPLTVIVSTPSGQTAIDSHRSQPRADQRLLAFAQPTKRRFRPPRWPLLVWLAAVLVVGWRLWTTASPVPDAAPLVSGVYQVEYVYDGDTLLLTTGQRVRLIGVDTPETVQRDHPVEPFGPEATQFTRAFVAGGEVRLEFDRERLDRYGRSLAYVWIGDRMLNEELVRAGLARFEPQYHYSETMKRRFRVAEENAKLAQRGMWALRAGVPDVVK
jgi:micrococcal nuclease